jgi:hypothetical protein
MSRAYSARDLGYSSGALFCLFLGLQPYNKTFIIIKYNYTVFYYNK